MIQPWSRVVSHIHCLEMDDPGKGIFQKRRGPQSHKKQEGKLSDVRDSGLGLWTLRPFPLQPLTGVAWFQKNFRLW